MRGRGATVLVPTEKQAEALIADIAAIQKRIEAFTISLTNAQRRGTTKMRPGGEDIVAALAKLAVERGFALPEVNVDDMEASLTLAKRVRPIAQAARQLVSRLDDTVTNGQSECWWAATALYTGLARVAGASPDLQTALQPIVSFFARKRRKKTPGNAVSPGAPPVKSAA